MRNLLHEEQDEIESRVGEMRDLLRKEWKETLPRLFELVDEQTGQSEEQAILDTLEIFAEHIGEKLEVLAKKTRLAAVKAGLKRGKLLKRKPALKGDI